MDDDSPPGAPEWVVTYGDMMSLLLTFFIMLVSMSEVKADERYRAVIESLAHYLGYPAAPISPPGSNFPMNSLIERLERLGSHIDRGTGRGGLRRQSLDGEEMRVYRNREGSGILAGLIAFDPGSAELGQESRDALAGIAARIAGKPHKVDVRGHAGGHVPAAGTAVDPETLAYRRARQVVEALQSLGIRHDRLRITVVTVSQAEQELESGQPADRVEVFALDQYSGELVGPRVE